MQRRKATRIPFALPAGFPHKVPMNRRDFFKRSSAALIGLSAAAYVPTTFAAEKTRRVGLIGAGWYGKSDLWRLVQVEPVDIISICDPDQHMLAGALDMAAQRQ